MKPEVKAPKIDFYNKLQLGEVSNIGWFTLDECLLLIRPYDVEKKNIIKLVDKNVKDIISNNSNNNCSKFSKQFRLYKSHKLLVNN